MQERESLKKQVQQLAARTHGQLGDVRVIQGRQISLLRNSTGMFLLPQFPSVDIQNLADPTDPSFGQYYSMVDFDAVDSGVIS